MSYSIVDQIPRQACPFPLPVEMAVFQAISIQCTEKQHAYLFSMYLENRRDQGEAMILWAIHNEIVFDCPVCGGERVRDWWHWGEGGRLYFCTGECFCADWPLRNGVCVEFS